MSTTKVEKSRVRDHIPGARQGQQSFVWEIHKICEGVTQNGEGANGTYISAHGLVDRPPPDVVF
jgi:hypothetical protein